MKVEVLYFANFKDITGKDCEYLELNENTIIGLISKIFRKYEPLENLIWDNCIKGLKKNISLVVNDKLIQDKEKEHLVLADGDKIAFLLPFSGG
ncbi:MAG: MoaD/ThiS family protein [Candidatus Hermodarchaeota archaeon]